MPSQKYSVTQPLIETLLTWVKSGEIAMPLEFIDVSLFEYEDFLAERGKATAAKLKQYYFSL